MTRRLYWRRLGGIAVLLLWAFCTGVPAQPRNECPPQAADAPAADPAEPAQDRGFLWRLERDGRTSYLYGTVHLARAEWTQPGPQVTAALRESDVVALEIDIADPVMAQRLRDAMAAQRRFPLTPALHERLQRQLALACLPPALMQALSPELLATTLVALSARVDGLDPAWGIDPAIGAAARAAGKPVLSLETPEQQLALLHTAHAEDAMDSISQMLDSLEAGDARQMLLRVAQVWADGDDAQLERYADWCDCTGSERERALMAALLSGRNPALADGIDAQHQAGRRIFAAVGSLHLMGLQGLPALMVARGYRVERVKRAADPP